MCVANLQELGHVVKPCLAHNKWAYAFRETAAVYALISR